MPEFLDYCAKHNIPVDFVSTHGYADDTVENLFHTHENVPMDDRVCRAIGRVHQQILASTTPKLPLMWTEWNVPSFGDCKARDTIYVGPALANDIRECHNLVTMMSWWTFDDVFEEDGPVKQPFYGGFGLIAAGGIRKPSFNAFALLHGLGEERIANPATDVLVTRRRDGTLVIAVWNLADPDKQGIVKTVKLEVSGVNPVGAARLSRLDAAHGNTLAAYEEMGKPRYPTQAQVAQLNQAAELPAPEQVALSNGQLTIHVGVDGLVIVEVPR